MTANEILELISKQWATTQDIKKLGSIGNHKAYAIRNKIIEDLKKQNRILSNRHVPMKEVVEYLGIDIKYLQKVSKE